MPVDGRGKGVQVDGPREGDLLDLFDGRRH